MKYRRRISTLMLVLLLLFMSAILSGCGMLAFVTSTETHESVAVSAVSGNDSNKAEQSIATYEVTPKLGVYDLSTESITVDITNTSDIDGGFGRHYRIEQQTDDGWAPLPFDIIVTEDWIILPAGETQTHTYSLLQDQYNYRPGTFRVVLLGVTGEPSVEFELK